MEEIVWMSTREVAQYAGVAEFTVKMWRSLGRGPKFHKAGGRVRYVKSEVDYWMLNGKNEGE